MEFSLLIWYVSECVLIVCVCVVCHASVHVCVCVCVLGGKKVMMEKEVEGNIRWYLLFITNAHALLESYCR